MFGLPSFARAVRGKCSHERWWVVTIMPLHPRYGGSFIKGVRETTDHA